MHQFVRASACKRSVCLQKGLCVKVCVCVTRLKRRKTSIGCLFMFSIYRNHAGGQSSLMLLCPTKLCIREGSIHWPRMCTCQRLFELLTKLLHCLVSPRVSPTIPSPTIPYLLYMSISLNEVLSFAEHLGIIIFGSSSHLMTILDTMVFSDYIHFAEDSSLTF